jgi:hypothetical protein
MYRNGTYVAFDGNATNDPTKGDLKYLGLLRAWNKSDKFRLTFSDSHKKTYQVRDSSLQETLKRRLTERLKNSKNMLIIISDGTNWNRGLLNWEIERAVDVYSLPLIIAYTGERAILNPLLMKDKWPKSLAERICNSTAMCIHIPFREKAIADAVPRFTIHSMRDDRLTSPYTKYTKEAYESWGYL